MQESPVTGLTVRLGERVLALSGREAWALAELIDGGMIGVTPLDNPAPRWSQYIMLLRRHGVVIETINEPHKGPFAGHHGRYVLRTPLEVIERQHGKARKVAA